MVQAGHSGLLGEIVAVGVAAALRRVAPVSTARSRRDGDRERKKEVHVHTYTHIFIYLHVCPATCLRMLLPVFGVTCLSSYLSTCFCLPF